MTALLELKQRIKGFYGQFEVYLQPVFKFVLALLYFLWINSNMGYMAQLNNLFVVLILALICSILPQTVMVYVGFLMIIGHGYALSMEVAGFLLVLILLMIIFLMRFSGRQNITAAFTPISFGFGIPAVLPIGAGLLGNALAAIPAACGVVLYYFIRLIKRQAGILAGTDLEIVEKLQLLADGLVQNWGMWITVFAFVLVILLVNLIRTRAFDYAWRIAIVVGGVAYVFILIAGSFMLSATVNLVSLLISTLISVLIGFVLEFFMFGGDYSRVEKLEYEDDEYFYYVKAVPKASVATSERSIKKINAEPIREERRKEESRETYANPIFHGDEKPLKKKQPPVHKQAQPVQKPADDEDIDFEKKLEESLRDL